MLIDAFKDMLICIFSILIMYIVAYIFWGKINLLKSRFIFDDVNMKVVFIVKDNEEVIEDIVRSVMLCDFTSKNVLSKNLFVLDMGSKDKTMDILKKLEKDYSSRFRVLEYENRESIFTDSNGQ